MRQRAFMPRNTLLCHSVVLPFAPWQILLQKSPRRSCRIKIRNNRIGANGFLNQRCALTPDLESILRTQTGKILLQQNQPVADIELIADVPHSDNFARDLVDALDASVTAACDCYAWPLEDLRDIDHLVPAHTRVDRRGEPSERHVRLPFRQNFDWANAWPAVDQVDRNPLPPEEAFMKRDIDTGELRLRVPHKLKAHAVLRLSD